VTAFSKQTLRIIDANLDRATEGLRVLEDIARFVLDSSSISARLKEIRHAIHDSFRHSNIALISARDASADVGRQPETVKEQASNIVETVIANARRLEQSVRVLEETARLPDTESPTTVFEDARYSIYEIEKELVALLSRRDKTARLTGRYVVVENESDLPHALELRAAAVQLKSYHLSRRECWQSAEKMRVSCTERDILFMITDFIDIAISTRADGVILDANSLPVAEARKLLRIDQLIGYTPSDIEDATIACEAGADFLLTPESGSLKQLESTGLPVVVPA